MKTYETGGSLFLISKKAGNFQFVRFFLYDDEKVIECDVLVTCCNCTRI